MARAITKCPNCGQTVSQFAAGCAVCGEDLVAARRELAERRQARPSLPSVGGASWLPRLDSRQWLIVGLMVVATVFSPFLGALITGLFALRAGQDREIGFRNVLLGILAVGVVLLVIVLVSPGTYGRVLFLFS